MSSECSVRQPLLIGSLPSLSSMNTGRQKKVPPAKRLGVLAMQFRCTRDEAERPPSPRRIPRPSPS
jgi:hypothetical protein